MFKVLIVLFMIIILKEIIETIKRKKLGEPLNKIFKGKNFYILYIGTLILIMAILLLIYFKGQINS